jgi:hypothetical protein
MQSRLRSESEVRSRRQPAERAQAFSPRREPWVEECSLTSVPSPARAGEGCRRRGEGHPTQGLRPGLLYVAPDGALKGA